MKLKDIFVLSIMLGAFSNLNARELRSSTLCDINDGNYIEAPESQDFAICVYMEAAYLTEEAAYLTEETGLYGYIYASDKIDVSKYLKMYQKHFQGMIAIKANLVKELPGFEIDILDLAEFIQTPEIDRTYSSIINSYKDYLINQKEENTILTMGNIFM